MNCLFPCLTGSPEDLCVTLILQCRLFHRAVMGDCLSWFHCMIESKRERRSERYRTSYENRNMDLAKDFIIWRTVKKMTSSGPQSKIGTFTWRHARSLRGFSTDQDTNLILPIVEACGSVGRTCSISCFSDSKPLYKSIKKRGIVIREASGRPACTHPLH